MTGRVASKLSSGALPQQEPGRTDEGRDAGTGEGKAARPSRGASDEFSRPPPIRDAGELFVVDQVLALAARVNDGRLNDTPGQFRPPVHPEYQALSRSLKDFVNFGGSSLTPDEIRRLVAAVHWVPPKPASGGAYTPGDRVVLRYVGSDPEDVQLIRGLVFSSSPSETYVLVARNNGFALLRDGERAGSVRILDLVSAAA